MAGKSNLDKLSELGQSVWIDYLSRDMLRSGELARMMREDAVVGVTSNPTIFRKAITGSNDYLPALRAMARRSPSPYEAFLEVARGDADGIEVLNQPQALFDLLDRPRAHRGDLVH